MMNLKETISFKTLREKGVSALEIKDDEVIQVVSKNSEIKIILTQEYFLKLASAYSSLLKDAGLKKEEIATTKDIEDMINGLESRLISIANKANE